MNSFVSYMKTVPASKGFPSLLLVTLKSLKLLLNKPKVATIDILPLDDTSIFGDHSQGSQIVDTPVNTKESLRHDCLSFKFKGYMNFEVVTCPSSSA
jgi:hypothetical protein